MQTYNFTFSIYFKDIVVFIFYHVLTLHKLTGSVMKAHTFRKKKSLKKLRALQNMPCTT